jgi:hypothetical protein
VVKRKIYDQGSLTEKMLEIAQEYLELQRLRDKLRKAEERQKTRGKAGQKKKGR